MGICSPRLASASVVGSSAVVSVHILSCVLIRPIVEKIVLVMVNITLIIIITLYLVLYKY